MTWILSLLGNKTAVKWGLIAAAVLAVVLYHRSLTSQITTLTKNNAVLSSALDQEKATVVELKKANQEWEAAARRTAEEFARLKEAADSARQEKERLDAIFGRHDLEALAKAKPGLIERRINDGSARIGRLLRCATTPGGCDADGNPSTASGS